MKQEQLHILISPLDWGLGHAARCIPLISKIIEAGHKVTLAGYGRSLVMLQKEFPFLESLEIKGFSPSYSGNGNLILHLFLRLPQFITSIIYEHRALKKIIAQRQIDIIISDNRYGLRNKNTRSILITHQVMVKTPRWLKFSEHLFYRVSCLLISRFDECWIPDEKEPPGLSGDLSHKYTIPVNAIFIGPLSRFQPSESQGGQVIGTKKIAAIISGPEPQRSIFEKLLIRQLKELNLPAIIIGGKPESDQAEFADGKLLIVPYMNSTELGSVISSSTLAICRSGYSSVMDLKALGAKVLFVPTPGQTEQIYLARLLQKSGTALWRAQEELDLATDLPEALKFTGFQIKIERNDLDALLAGLKKK